MSEQRIGLAEEAFSFLGDGLRLAILQALAERETDAGPRERTIAYSDLRRAVGERDSGKFNFHLRKLTGRFVTHTDDGYRLREPGREAVRLLERGVVDAEANFESTDVDESCPLCGAGIRVVYDDHHILTTCDTCAGLFGMDGCPSGTITGAVLPPATVDGRDPESLFYRAHRVLERRLHDMVDGVCLECGGDVVANLRYCDDHESSAERTCTACNTSYPALAELVCETCGRGRVTHPLFGNPDVGDDVCPPPVRDGDLTAWDRFYAALSWSVNPSERGELAFQHPDHGRRLVVDSELNLVG